MLRDIWTKTLWEQRRALLGWAIGFAGVSLLYGGFYPFAATPEYADLIEGLPPALSEAFGWDEIASAHGYLGATVYGILGPVLAIVMAIGLGARAIAGSEEDGSLELLIAHPVTRTRVVAQKSAALALTTLGAGVVVFLAIIAIRGPIDLELSTGNLALASLNMALLGLVFGCLAVLLGSIVGRRGVAIGGAAGAAVVMFLANGLAPQVEALAWLENVSPFHWADGTAALRDGFDLAATLVLVAVPLILVTAAAFTFNRRDVGV